MNIRKWLIAICLLLCALALAACDTPASTCADAAAPIATPPRVEALAATDRAVTSFSVSRAFSSDMVIQRDEPIRVWGWAPESDNGKTVTATFAGQTAEGKIEDGAWLLTFEEGFAASAAMGNHMTVTCGDSKIVFENVLVGDVYMVIGQSNVAYGMNAHCINHGLSLSSFADAKAPIRLRYNTLNDTAGYPARGTTEVCEDVVNGRPWWTPTVSNIDQFTALGYLFALGVVEKTGGEIPIGIIEIDGNGQPIGAFMPNEVAGATDSDTLNQNSGIFVPPGVNGTHARYMYNHYMYPYERYAMAGLIWYQGESDYAKETADTFVDKFVALMEYMRSTHNLKNKDFPVYIVEIPTIYSKPADHTGAWHFLDLGYIRAEMGSIPQKLSNSYLAVSSDLFTNDRYDNSLHPDIKDGQAARLADLAGSVCYNLTVLDEAAGPILKDYAVSEDRKTVTLTFSNVGAGLATSDGGTAVKGLAAFNRVGGIIEDSSLSATITASDTVTITSAKSMYGVAYNFVYDNFYGEEINLCNSNGRIAAAFTFSEARMYQVRHEILGEETELVSPGAEDVYAIHFRADSELVSVGTQLYKDTVGGGTVTLALYEFKTDYATTVAAEPLVSKTWTSFDPYTWAELSVGRNRTWDPGEYLLVISGVEDTRLQAGAAHEGQFCYRNGEYGADTSLLLALTYNSKVEKAYGIPTDVNGETEPETQPEPVPETLPETESEETLPESKVEDTVSVDTAAESESDSAPSTETDAGDAGGCASVYGAVAVIGMLTLAAGALLRRREGTQIKPS